MIQSAPEDIFQVLNLAIKFNNSDAQSKCLAKWHEFGHLLLETKSFLSCSQPVLKLVLDTDFNLRDEVKVFTAVIHWAKNQCKNNHFSPDVALNIRYMLGDAFQSIRFHQMTAKQFVTCQSLHADVFSADELRASASQILKNDSSEEQLNTGLSCDRKEHLERRFLKSSVNKVDNAFATIEMMFGNSTTANVFFAYDSDCTEDSRLIYAHKCILAVKSPIFRKIFFEENGNTSSYPITDASYDEFSTFIHLFYRKTIDGLVTMDNVNRIISLAKSYEASEIIEQCIRFAVESIGFENVFRVLDMCFLYSNTDTVCVCLDWIVANEKEMHTAFHGDSLVGCSHKTVKFALAIKIPNRRDVDVFRASFQWAKKFCEQNQIEPTPENVRKALGDAFNLIRVTKVSENEINAVAPGFLSK